MICPRCNLLMSLDGSCDCPEQDRVPLARTMFRRVNVRLEALDLEARAYANPSLDVKIALSGNPCLVPSCDYLAGDGFVCPTCVEEWEVHLGNVTALVEDLELAQRKQARFGTREGNALVANGRTTSETRHLHTRHPNHIEPPMPVDLRAGYWLDRLRNELVGQIRLICEVNALDVPKLDTTVAMSRWLLGKAYRIAYLPEQDGWGLVHDLDQTYRDCVDAIDAPSRRKYVRVCDCGLSVWARGEKSRCACGKVYDVEAEHDARMDDARDYLVTLREAATLAKIPLNTVRSWANPARGRLAVRVDHRGERVVRFGDVADLAATRRETA